MSDVTTLPMHTLDGQPTTFGALTAGKLTLVVNVASRCGLTPQYTKLEALQKEIGGEHFTVLGVPSNQFGGQEPGTAQEIQEFCSATYGVSFPMTAKVDVNGSDRDALYDELTVAADGSGAAGDVQWNFEKFLVSRGRVVGRFRPRTEPDDPALRAAIDTHLAG